MVVGGNLPDLDVLYTAWGGTTLDYLLHHRGHTHTVVGVLIQSLLLYAAVRLWWRYRKVEPSASDVRVFAGLALLAPLLHLALDLTNSYGVHPFWPVDDRWYCSGAPRVEPGAGRGMITTSQTPRTLRRGHNACEVHADSAKWHGSRANWWRRGESNP